MAKTAFKLTILYASENGKSIQYARQLHDIFSNNAFDVKVMSMNDFDFSTLSAEKFILFVGSTTGNGEPPENGAKFFDLLLEMADGAANCSRRSSIVEPPLTPAYNNDGVTLSTVLKSHRSNSTVESITAPTSPIFGPSSSTVNNPQRRLLTKSYSLQNNAQDVAAEKFLLRLSQTPNISEEKPLVNVNYAVFALGCSAYPKFCNFGKQLDRVLGRRLGAKPLIKLTCSDDLHGQDQTFHHWTETVLKKACDLFDVRSGQSQTFDEKSRRKSSIVSNVQYRLQFANPTSETAMAERKIQVINNLAKLHGRTNVQKARFVRKTYLQSPESPRQTILIELSYDQSVAFEPGDHFGIFAQNNANIVNEILRRLRFPLLKFSSTSAPDQIFAMECSSASKWTLAERLPACSLREAFTHYLDITTPPTQTMLEQLSPYCTDKRDRKRMKSLASNLNEYELWKMYSRPHLAEVFNEFPSLRAIEPTLLLSQLPLLQPRFYSISSSPHENKIHLTVKCVRYRTQGELGPEHFGVCSTYLERLDETSVVPYFIRHTPLFSLPTNRILPIILIGAGTGIAPFRGFWRHRDWQKKSGDFEPWLQNTGSMELYYGCRQLGVDDVYADELKSMLEGHILQDVQLALSKPTSGRKMYVQDLLTQNAEHIYRTIVQCGGHIYVCGDATMATGVLRVVTNIVMEGGQLTRTAAKEFLDSMKMTNRYHEDIFGVTASILQAAGRKASVALLK